ncbi:TPA: hypothetical protein H1S97_004351 [Salmonella enterica]|nr:hypothetical protein [Salmonella enterica subsp. enterica serovar Bonariensis]HAK3805566.1 hypothetical protein [Salmonella enterica]
MKTNINHLSLSWSVSKGRETYGYNICRLDDRNNGERFKCMGGGYDMVGTVFADWLCANYQERLLAIKDRASHVFPIDGAHHPANKPDSLYGMRYHEKDNRVDIDGACGLDCVLRIAELIGLDIDREYIAKGRRRGETVGWFISEKE